MAAADPRCLVRLSPAQLTVLCWSAATLGVGAVCAPPLRLPPSTPSHPLLKPRAQEPRPLVLASAGEGAGDRGGARPHAWLAYLLRQCHGALRCLAPHHLGQMAWAVAALSSQAEGAVRRWDCRVGLGRAGWGWGGAGRVRLAATPLMFAHLTGSSTGLGALLCSSL